MNVGWTFLVEEYKALQAEILQRNTQSLVIATACMTGFVTALAGIFSGVINPWGGAAVLCLIVFIFLGTMCWAHNDTKWCEERLLAIERFVNDACVDDEEADFPLAWQREYGMSTRGTRNRFKWPFQRSKSQKPAAQAGPQS